MVPCPRTPFSRIPLLSRTIPKKDPISQEGADRRSLGYRYQLITLSCLERGATCPSGGASSEKSERNGGILT